MKKSILPSLRPKKKTSKRLSLENSKLKTEIDTYQNEGTNQGPKPMDPLELKISEGDLMHLMVMRKAEEKSGKTRPNTNKALLEVKGPELIKTQNYYLQINRLLKREYYVDIKTQNYRGIEDIKTWTEKGPEIVKDKKSEDNISKMAKKTPAKKMSKSPAMKKKETPIRSSSSPQIKAKFAFNSAINDKVSFEFGGDGDMWVMEVDAIVLSTDGVLSMHDMARPAYEKAKPHLSDETQILKQNGFTPKVVGDTVTTCGYQLPAYYCIHVHIPMGAAGGDNLWTCYFHSLNAMKELNMKSIAIPCLGTGGYAVSSEKACQSALKAVRDWLEDDWNLNSIDRIVFCVYKAVDVTNYMEYIPAYFPIDPNVMVNQDEVKIEDYIKPLNGHKWLQMDVVKTKLLDGELLNKCTKFSLSGRAESINDLFFQMLQNSSSKEGFPISELDCTSCYHLTDRSLKIIVKIFPDLSKVIFDGCPKITERGLQELTKHGENLNYASFVGCNIGSWDGLSSKSSIRQMIPSFLGCPVEKILESKMATCNIYKVIILRTPSMYKLTPSLASQFSGDKSKVEKWEGLIRKEAYTMGAATVNIIECDVSLLSLVNTPRTIIVMPPIQYDGPYYHRMLCSALCSDYDNPVVLLTKDAKKLVTDIGKRLDKVVRDTMKNVGQLQWKDQLNVSQLYALAESMKSRKIIEMKAEQLTVKSTQWKDIFKTINIEYPDMEEIPIEYLDECREYAKQSKIGQISDDRLKNGFRLLAILGELIVLPNSSWFISDLNYFQELLIALMKAKNKKDNRKLAPCLPIEASAFSVLPFFSSLKDSCGMKRSQAQSFLQLLADSHLLLYLPHPWLNEFSPEPAGIFFASLPKDPPVELSMYWADHWTNEEQDLIMMYELLMYPPVPCMQAIMQDCCRFVAPIFVWEHGLLGTHGCVEVLIELRKKDESCHIFMGTRTLNYMDPGKNKQNPNNAVEVWGKETINRFDEVIKSTFQLMRQSVEYCLLKSHTYFTAKVKCFDCRVDDRVHYYDVLKFTTSDEKTITCTTFKTTYTLANFGLDGYFRLHCDHSAIASTYYTGEKRCALCWKYYDTNPDSLYCQICYLCMECIMTLKNNELLLDPDASNIHGGSTCTYCKGLVYGNSKEIVETHVRNCYKATMFSNWFVRSGQKYTMAGMPFILKFTLMLPHSSHVIIRAIAELEHIWVGFQKRLNDYNIDYHQISEITEAGLLIYAQMTMKFDQRVIQLRTECNIIHEFEIDDEQTAIFIRFTKNGASAFVHSDNSSPPQVVKSYKGMRLEAKDRKNPHLTRVATIEDCDNQGQVEIHFDGWAETFDYFASINDPDLHPIGYCKHVEIKLDPPLGNTDKEFTWKEYLVGTSGAIPVPLEFFTKEQSKGCPDILKEGNTAKSDSQWKDGMKLEALDRFNSHMICVATVEEVLENGKLVKISLDGQKDSVDHMVTNSPDLHPTGFCEHIGIILQSPQDQNSTSKPFNWIQYLKDTKSTPVPHDLFTKNQTRGCPAFARFSEQQENDSAILVNKMDHSKRSFILRSNAILLNSTLERARAVSTVTFLGVLPNVIEPDEMEYPKPALTRNFASERTQSLHILCNRTNFTDPTSELGSDLAQQLSSFSKIDVDMTSQASRAFGVHLTGAHEIIHKDSVERLNQMLNETSDATNVKSKSKQKKPKANNSEDDSKNKNLSIHTNHQLLKWIAKQTASSLAVFVKAKVAPLDNAVAANLTNWKISDPDQAAESALRYSLLTFHTLMVLVNINIYEPNIQSFEDNVALILKRWTLKDNDYDQSISFPCPYHTLSSSAFRVLPTTDLENIDGEYKSKIMQDYQNSTQIGIIIYDNVAPNLDEIAKFSNLYCLCLKQIQLTKFTIFNPRWVETLKILDLQINPLREVPEVVFKLTNLRNLVLRACGIASITTKITELERLEELNLSYNILTEIPDCITQMKCLRSLKLDGVPFYETKHAPITLDSILDQFVAYGVMSHKDYPKIEEKMPAQAKKYGLESLATAPVEVEQVEQLNSFLSAKYTPRYPKGKFPVHLCKLKRLRHLNYSRQHLTFLPAEIGNLRQLEELFLDNCLFLEGLSEQLGALPNFERVTLQGCPAIKTPPLEIVKKGTPSVMAYLKRLLHGFRECKRTKLMLVGLGGAGKTSLVRALLSGNYQSSGTASDEITDGIDIVDWAVRVPINNEEQTVNYSVWDFAGQAVYYNTHQFFLSNRAIYLLLWNSRLGYEHAGLDFWLSSISCHATKAPIFVVATHADQVFHADLPKDEIKEAFPQVVEFYHISSLTGQGVQALATQLFQTTLDQKYMGEKVPTLWLDLEKEMLAQRRQNKIIDFKTVEDKASQIGITTKAESLLFLHELGSVQYFSNEFLRDRVVINPQWLVDVMADLISVKESVIKDGRFKRDDVSKIWSTYDKELHPWLLRLTEEFDLTYYLPSEEVNIVPCLLPEQEPPFEWPKIQDSSIREMKLMYKFQYLPAGLFNRTQTRLCQYSDSSAVWKKGSLLHKNKHIALIRQTRDKELSLTVQGSRPENVLFLVHEVLETLIQEFFQGVSYDLSLPCVDCVNSGSQDPHLFTAKQIRRAGDLKAPFLQCAKNFHIVALAALQEFIPPNNTADYANHLSGMMHDLKELKSNITVDALFLYHEQDVMDMKNQLSPHNISADLDSQGITCSMLEANKCKEGKVGMELGVKLSSSLVILTYVSPTFCQDQTCSDAFVFIRNGSQKPMIDLVPGLTDEWKKTHVGMLVATEMYVRLRVEKYQHNIQEIVKRIESKKTLRTNSTKVRDAFPVFISYCWSNSKEAVMRGTAVIEGAVGPVDPREIDAFLTDHNIKCWLDTRCARDGALFEEIADALRQAKLVVACVSDEYLNSRNCMLEFRFATGILKLPLILCSVGTGKNWQTSEIALLALGAPRVDFQSRNDSDFDTLLSFLHKLLPQDLPRTHNSSSLLSKKILKSQKSKNVSNEVQDPGKDYSAYQELCELAQRKFLQQVSHVAVALKGADTAFSAPFPRICFMDVKDAEEIENTSSKPGTAVNRPATSSSKEETSILDNIETNQLVVRILCEYEGGWHSVPSSMQLVQQGLGAKEILIQSAAYQSQLFSILQHSPVTVNLLQLKDTDSILLELKQMALENFENFEIAYKLVSQLARASDAAMTRGGLLRCSLHSRRVVWLCAEHQKVARDTIANDVLDTDDIGFTDTNDHRKVMFTRQQTVLEEEDASSQLKEITQSSNSTLSENVSPEPSVKNGQNAIGIDKQVETADGKEPQSKSKPKSKMCVII